MGVQMQIRIGIFDRARWSHYQWLVLIVNSWMRLVRGEGTASEITVVRSLRDSTNTITKRMYDLVKAERRILSHSQIPLELPTRTTDIWCHTDHHGRWKRVT